MKAIYVITAALCGLSLSTQLVLGQGSLTPPPGAPAPTMKTLDQIEPRTPITSLIYTISQPGSYYLTTNLTGGAFNGINITANGVTLDLMGFELVGGPGNQGFGITVSGTRTNITVRNGTVRNWAGDGVHLSAARNCVLQNVRALHNSEAGLVVGDGSVVRSCVASFNTSDGIVGGDACSILDCVAFTNNANGIRIGAAGVVRDCSAMRNGAAGLITAEASTIKDCSAAYNSSTGVWTGPGSTVTGCSTYANKGHGITDDSGTLGVPGLSVANCTANYNDQDGFYLSNGSTVKNCLSKGNKGNGIRTNVGSTITDCSANDNMGTGIILYARSTLNGCTASGNSFNGIEALRQCTIVGCTVIDNFVNGIHVTENGNRLDGNTSTDNGNDGISIDATATKNVVVRNISSGNANFQYRVPGLPGQPPAAANVVGPIVADATTANAWANFGP